MVEDAAPLGEPLARDGRGINLLHGSDELYSEAGGRRQARPASCERRQLGVRGKTTMRRRYRTRLVKRLVLGPLAAFATMRACVPSPSSLRDDSPRRRGGDDESAGPTTTVADPDRRRRRRPKRRPLRRRPRPRRTGRPGRASPDGAGARRSPLPSRSPTRRRSGRSGSCTGSSSRTTPG